MDLKPTAKKAIILSAAALLLLALVPSPAWAPHYKIGPNNSGFQGQSVSPTEPAKPPALSIPSKAQGATPPGMLKSKAALPAPPKHYQLEPEAGAVRFGDGQHGSRLPTGQGTSAKYKAGQGVQGALPAPPVKGPGALGSMPLPPPQGVSPADPTSPPLPGGASIQKVPDTSQGGDTVPMEDVSLNYDKVKEDYSPQGSSKKGGNVETTWKVEEGEK